jgi:Ca2+/H+ antiporter, TMEM165/GDT1 family
MLWEYLTLFVMAATPLVELLVVIPVGIGYGLPPVSVALVTVLGNALPVLGIVVLYERWRGWRERRRAERGEEASAPSARWERARRLWARYGMPGLALLAPLVTGVHFAAIAALALGTPRRTVAVWMGLSIMLWTVGMTLASVAGLEGWRQLVS